MERKRSTQKHLGNAPAKRAPSGAAVFQESVTRSIATALFREWARTGYAALSIEAVAKQAGVGKAAIYRRWPSKLEMVLDLTSTIAVDVAVAPDAGDLREDVRTLLLQLRRVLRHPLVKRILPDLQAEMQRNPVMERAIRSRLQAQRRARAETVLRRAIERGELDKKLDVEMGVDLLGSMLFWRLIVTGGRADDAYVERLADVTVAALKVANRS